MRRKFNWLCLGILIGGCSPIYYAPNSVNVPMLGSKGEGAISAHHGDHDSLNVHAAYSPASNLGVLFDIYRVSGSDDSNTNGGSGSMVETGAGYYRQFKGRYIFDTYGLIGFAGLENHFPSADLSNPSPGTIRARFVRYGFQPSFGFRAKFVDLSGAFRILGVRYYNVRGNLVRGAVDEVDYLKNQSTLFLFEPVLTARVGYDFLKLQLQVGQSENLTDPDFKQSKDIVSWGVVYTFGRN